MPRVFGRGSRSQPAALVSEHLEIYLADHRAGIVALRGIRSEALWLSMYGLPMSSNAIYIVLSRARMKHWASRSIRTCSEILRPPASRSMTQNTLALPHACSAIATSRPPNAITTKRALSKQADGCKIPFWRVVMGWLAPDDPESDPVMLKEG